MKRVAEKQITREEVENATDESVAEKATHFERAAPDVLAKRRILKVRRARPAHAAQPAASKPNPFASLKLPEPSVAPAQPASEAALAEKGENANAADKPLAVAAGDSVAEHKQKPLQVCDSDAPDAPDAPDAHRLAVLASAETQRDKPGKPDAVAESVQDKQQAVQVEQHVPAPSSEKSDKAESERVESEGAMHESAKEKSAPEKDETPNKHIEHDCADKDASGKTIPTAVAQGDKAGATERAHTDKVANEKETHKEGDEGKQVEDKPSTQNGSNGTKADSQQVVEKEEKEIENGGDAKRSAVNANGAKGAIIFGGGASNNIKSFATAATTDGSFKFDAGAVAVPATNVECHDFKEQPVTSGEEDEETLFRMRAKLYSLEGDSEKKRWKECGVGALKMNEHKQSKRVRLLMRSEGVLRVVLNTRLYKHVKLDRATERSIRFQGFEERTAKCYLLRFATHDACAEFIAAVEKWKETQEEK
ncbi:unnamed protein product [Agarophyton chilense]